MSKSKAVIALDSNGIRDLLRSDEFMNECEKYAYQARSRLGSGYSVNSMKGRGRVNAEVVAESAEARRDNLKNNSILKAVRGS